VAFAAQNVGREEVEAAALVERIAAATEDLLAELPERRVPPRTEPPLRRIARTAG
jgi:hypothetical protein